MIRVGRIVYGGGNTQIPSYPGFETIMVMTKSSKYGSLGPYVLCDEQERNMENLWQFSKVYEKVPATVARKSRFDNTIIWNHKAETHVDGKGEEVSLLPEYWAWRQKGMNAPHPIRYPVGFNHRHKCLFAIPLDASPLTALQKLDYVQSRKAIYLPLFCRLVTTQPQFATLLDKLNNGENLLIVEVDGPHEESLEYYQRTYGTGPNFIENNTILVNQRNMQIMLNDSKHPFGHGYCLAMALLGVDQNPAWLSAPL